MRICRGGKLLIRLHSGRWDEQVGEISEQVRIPPDVVSILERHGPLLRQ